MITAVHTMIYRRTPNAARAFFKDILNFPHVDAGGGHREANNGGTDGEE